MICFIMLQANGKVKISPEHLEALILTLDTEAFACAICLRKSKRRYDIRKHIRLVHLKERKHMCCFCKASFQQRCDTIRHLKKCRVAMEIIN